MWSETRAESVCPDGKIVEHDFSFFLSFQRIHTLFMTVIIVFVGGGREVEGWALIG